LRHGIFALKLYFLTKFHIKDKKYFGKKHNFV
jgi:hypothetical protein